LDEIFQVDKISYRVQKLDSRKETHSSRRFINLELTLAVGTILSPWDCTRVELGEAGPWDESRLLIRFSLERIFQLDSPFIPFSRDA
jgi:hypothetical protein